MSHTDLLYKSFSTFFISNEAAGQGRIHIKEFLWEMERELRSSEVARGLSICLCLREPGLGLPVFIGAGALRKQ